MEGSRRDIQGYSELHLPHPLEAQHPRVTVSGGAATVTPAEGAGSHGTERLGEAADYALYRSKMLGRDQPTSVLVLAGPSSVPEREAAGETAVRDADGKARRSA